MDAWSEGAGAPWFSAESAASGLAVNFGPRRPDT
jgi:hypothetical protein